MQQTTRAIVVGGSMAGLFAARVLSELVTHVDVYERDAISEHPVPRAHVPQGRHPHVLLTSGELAMERWFPGLVPELERLGAVRLRGEHGWWLQGGAYRAQGDWGAGALSVTRPVLEQAVRRRVAMIPNVRLHEATPVQRLAVEQAAGRPPRVAGIIVDDRTRTADLVVDCSGRHSKIVHRLEQDGLVVPPVSRIDVGLTYATRFLRRTPRDVDGGFVLVSPDLSVSGRGAALFPVECERWIVALTGMHDDRPPSDDRGYREFAASLGTPAIAALLDRCDPLGPVISYRFPSSQWRHFEKAPRLLAGLLFMGDSVASFTPVYGQGISSAALQAEAMGAAVRRHGVRSPRLPRAVQRAAARVVATPWTIAAGADFSHPATTGSKPAGTDLLNRYFARVMLAIHTSLPVQRELMQVQNLTAAPSSLLRPSTVVRVLRAARRSPVMTGAPVGGPTVAEPAREPVTV